jgi:hypothetical protein
MIIGALTSDFTTDAADVVNDNAGGASLSLSTDTPFSEGRSVVVAGSAFVNVAFDQAASEVFISVWGKISFAVGTWAIVLFDADAVAQCSVVCNLSTGSVELRRGDELTGTVLGTTASGFFNSTNWRNAQARFVIHPSTGIAQLRDNSNTQVLNLTGQNTRGGSLNNNAIYALIRTQNPSSSFTCKDLTFNDTTGDAPTSWPGQVRQHTRTTAGAGSAAGMSVSGAASNWQANATPPDGDTSTTTGTGTQADSYSGTSAPNGGLIYAVRGYTFGRRRVQPLAAPRLKLGATTTDYIPRQFPAFTGYRRLRTPFVTKNISTAGAWTRGAVNSTEFGAAVGGTRGPRRYWRLLMWNCNNAFNFVIGEIEMRETAGGSDVSTSGQAFGAPGASGNFSNAFDNNVGTFHNSSNADPGAWIAQDFGATPRSINEIVLTATNTGGLEARMPTWFTVQSSDDRANWVDEWWCSSGSYTSGQSRTFTRPASSGAMRWWGIVCLGTHLGSGSIYSFSEIAFKNGGANLLTGGGGAAASGSSLGTNPGNAVDGNNGTDWYVDTFAGYMPHFWIYDRGIGNELSSIATIDIRAASGTPRVPLRFGLIAGNILPSNDGVVTALRDIFETTQFTAGESRTFTTASEQSLFTAAGMEVFYDTLQSGLLDPGANIRRGFFVTDDRGLT